MTKQIHWAWVILIASFATVFTYYSIRLGYGILMPEMIVSLKITKAEAGSIASSFFIAYIIFVPLLGYLIDRINARLLVALFSCILATGTFLMGKPETLLQACLSFFIVGVGGSAMWTPVVTLVQRWFAANHRGMALGIMSIGYAIGYGLMGLILPPLTARYGWRACWFILSVPAFALVLLNSLLIRTRPQDLNLTAWGDKPFLAPEGHFVVNREKIPYAKLLRFRNFWLGGISYFFIAYAAYVVNLFIVTYGNLELKFSFAQAAQLASAIAFSGLPGALLFPILSDFIGRKKCVIIINASLAFSILLIIWAGNHRSALFIAACIYGVFYAAVWPMYAAAAADFFPRDATGSVLGLWTIFYGLALILAPAAGGYIADVTGTLFYSFLTGIISGTLATFIFLPVKKFKEPLPN